VSKGEAFCSEADRIYQRLLTTPGLQWADSATLKLIELMMTQADMQYLDTQLLIQDYKFLHNRIQQAADALNC
jgi:predicted ATPase